MAAFDAEVGRDKPGITCCIRKRGNTQNMMESYKKKDTETSLNGLLLSGQTRTVQASNK